MRKVKISTERYETMGARNPRVYPLYKSTFLFRFLDKFENGAYQVRGTWQDCRELYCSRFKALFDKNYMRSYDNEVEAIDLRKTRVMVFVKETKTIIRSKECMAASLKLINIFERYLGWSLSTLSIGVPCNESIGENPELFVFIGSSKWLRSPQLLSLYLLLIRVGLMRRYRKRVFDVKDIGDLEAKIKALGKVNAYMVRRDIGSFKRLFNKELVLLMDNIDKVFFKNRRQVQYIQSAFAEGMDRFLTNGNGPKQTVEAWKEIKKNRRKEC